METSGKKIEVLVDHFYPVTGGLAIHCLRVYGILSRRGWQITVRATKNTTEEKNVLPARGSVSGIEIFRYSFENYNFNPWALKIDYRGAAVVCLNELVILPHYFVYIYSYLLKLFSRRNFAVVLTSHGLFTTDIGVYRSLKRKIKRIIDRTLGVFLINRTVNRVHSISQTEKDGLVAAGVNPEIIEVIPNGVDEEAFKDIDSLASADVKNLVSEFGIYLLQIGRLDRHKNYEATIKALCLLPEEIKYVILGADEDRDYKQELQQLIARLSLEKRVIFAGVIKGADKFYLLKHALVYIHMAHSEGFGMVVQEAMSQGAVCLVSRGTGLEELVTDGVNGYALSKDDAEGIAQKIGFIFNHPDDPELQEIRRNGFLYAKSRDWEKVAGSMEELFNRAIIDNQRAYDGQ
ncbi:MAG: glycosyltransferase family 4 protein [Candidatus Doudnabacteria bacterium]|nr:glycosyltransferase family 4 protein [Candidatus Doudnabacteria bacterium]